MHIPIPFACKQMHLEELEDDDGDRVVLAEGREALGSSVGNAILCRTKLSQ